VRSPFPTRSCHGRFAVPFVEVIQLYRPKGLYEARGSHVENAQLVSRGENLSPKAARSVQQSARESNTNEVA
jgi:hypothetical protein